GLFARRLDRVAVREFREIQIALTGELERHHAPYFLGERVDGDELPVLNDGGALDRAPELPHVSGPGISFEGCERFGSETGCDGTGRWCAFGEEALREQRDVARAVAQGGQLDHADIEPEP